MARPFCLQQAFAAGKGAAIGKAAYHLFHELIKSSPGFYPLWVFAKPPPITAFPNICLLYTSPGATEMFTQEVNIGTDAAYRVVEFTGKYQEAAGTITSPVSYTHLSQTTDANGEAQFALATCSNSYTVTATGYATVSDSVNVTASTTLEVALVSENSIEFMLDADPATDLTAATVVITAGTGTEVYNGLGDSSLDLGQLADGEYTYSVTLDNYYTVSDTFVVENGAASGNSASLQQAADAKYNVTFDFTGGNTITLNIDGTQYDNRCV